MSDVLAVCDRHGVIQEVNQALADLVGKGTGLGLSISYGIVERQRGQLKASNHPQGGAVLMLTLPLA